MKPRHIIERTEVRVVYNDRFLYFGVRCFDGNPKTIFTSTLGRDARLWNDDHIELVLDMFHDGRNAYHFAVNAAGAMTDGRIVENRGADVNWDGIWHSERAVERGSRNR